MPSRLTFELPPQSLVTPDQPWRLSSVGEIYVIVRVATSKDIIAGLHIWLVRSDDERHWTIRILVGKRGEVGTFARFVASAHRAGTGTLSI